MSNPDSTNSPSVSALLCVGLFLLIAAVILWLDAGTLPEANAMGVGPAAGLRLISGLLLILAGAHFFAAWRRRSVYVPSQSGSSADKVSLIWGIGGMAAMSALVAFNGGFILAATVLFTATAKAFGKPVGRFPLALAWSYRWSRPYSLPNCSCSRCPRGLSKAFYTRIPKWKHSTIWRMDYGSRSNPATCFLLQSAYFWVPLSASCQASALP
ncbi:hypothetical protein [Advenella kashmirensis]|uniref:hypothetical protein n=1 Tax=Advenella kashmirensis TaxID=310575 RepID=UPI001EE65B56|nr:hypothetical protein [Advenella kashmirensis]